MSKIIRRIVFALILVLTMAALLASCSKDDGVIEYKPTLGGYEVVGLADKSATDVVIPEKFNGKSVVAIGENAFRGTNIESISIPTSVKSFGLNAFELCTSLKKVELVDAARFADATFANEYANPLWSGAELYEGGNKIEELALSSEAVSNYAYVGAGIKTLNLSGVKTIGNGAFKNCASLSSVNFGDKIESIGVSAFSECGILELALGETVKSVGHSAFSGNASLVSVTLPASITEIPDRAFFGCSSLKNINLDNITVIGEGAFYECISLETVKISAKTVNIDEYAFYSCSGLKTLTISEGSALESICEAAFRGCTALESANLDAAKSLKTIDKHAFEYCVSLVDLKVPSSIETLGDWAFASCSSLDLYVGEGVGYIGNEENNYVIVYKLVDKERTTVDFMSGVKFIHQGAFFGEKGVTIVTMQSGVLTMGAQSFAFCTGLKEITIAKTLKSVGDGAIMGCTSLEKLRFKGNSTQWTDSKSDTYVKKGTNWNYNAASYKIYYG